MAAEKGGMMEDPRSRRPPFRLRIDAAGVREAASAAVFLGSWVPCFIGGDASASLDSASAFSLFLPCGCFVAAVLALVLRKAHARRFARGRAFLVAAVAAYVAGFAFHVVCAAVGTASLAVASGLSGVAAGAGVVVVCGWRCMRAQPADFSRMLVAGAFAGLFLCAVIFVGNALPPVGKALLSFAFASVAGVCDLRLILRREDAAEHRRCGGDAGKDGGRPRLQGGIFSVLATSTAGLVLFVLIGNLQGTVAAGPVSFDGATGLAIGSILVFALSAAVRRDAIVPALFWVVFPSCAGVLVVLNSFPKDTVVAALSAGLAFAFFSTIIVFAVVCLVHIAARGECAPEIATAPPFALAAAALVAARLFGGSGAAEDETGRVMLVLTTAYFVFLMVVPALRLWRVRKGDEEGPSVGGARSGEAALEDACGRLAEDRGLSRREREVLLYLAQGYTSPYIAQALFISDSTVRSHTKSIYRKIGARSRTEVIERVRGVAAAAGASSALR